MICRIKGKGNESLNGIAGDLMVQIFVSPDEKFSREGYDLHSQKEITVT
jgi:DnaJ-class molecular chaperone